MLAAQVDADQSISAVWNIPTSIFGGGLLVSTSPTADSTGELQHGTDYYYGVLATGRSGVTTFRTPVLTFKQPTTVYVQVQLNSPFFFSNPSNYNCNEGDLRVNCDSQIVQLTINPTTGSGGSSGGSGGTTTAQLGVSETTQTVQAGGSVVYDVTYGGFTSAFALKVTGLPTGAASSWPSGSGGKVAVTVTTSPQTPPGQYTLTVSGTSDKQTASTTMTLVVTGTSAPTPTPTPKPTHVASVVVRVIGKGSVVGSGISCPGTCTKTVPGTTIVLRAEAASGYHLAAWTGGGCPPAAFVGVIITAKRYDTCTLSKIRYQPDFSTWQWSNAYTSGGLSNGANLVLNITAKFVKSP